MIPYKIDPVVKSSIQCAATGKKASKNLEAKTVNNTLLAYEQGKFTLAQLGAFCAGLNQKGMSEVEKPLEKMFPGLFQKNFKTTFKSYGIEKLLKPISKLIFDLAEGKTLSYTHTKKIADFIYREKTPDFWKGFIASTLRVRYETEEEYRGLLDSLQDRFNSTICFNGVDKVKKSFPIIQITEPFDGHVHCYNITPIIAKYLSARSCVVLTGGPCSGPKYGLNIHDISHYLVQTKQIHYLKNYNDLKKGQVYYLNTHDLYKNFSNKLIDGVSQNSFENPLKIWHNIRQQIFKRPFMATIERFLNPLKADLLITSAFHTPYIKKMKKLALQAGFLNSFIISRGIEGSTNFSAYRTGKIYVVGKNINKKNSNKKSINEEIEFCSKDLGLTRLLDEKLEKISLRENIRLIENYLLTKKSGNEVFDLRVKITKAAIEQAWTNWMP